MDLLHMKDFFGSDIEYSLLCVEKSCKPIMGLAQPRKRTKIAHDPRNLAWTSATDSYGHRLMQQQGWKAGEALGARNKYRSGADIEAARVMVQYKDDNLGLGATLKSKDIASQRTGFDAFQGLLGRLNAKNEDEVKAVEKKLDDKKLAMFAQGRWGGMVFVPGGLLVQNDPYKQKLELDKKRAEQEQADRQIEQQDSKSNEHIMGTHTREPETEKARLKAEKKQRKEEKRLRKEQRLLGKSKKSEKIPSKTSLPTPEASSSNEEEKHQQGKKRKAHSDEVPMAVSRSSSMKNGRHILRGKNISAKRAAFADLKGLDEIFMRKA